jgi:hypothetical protein
MDFKQAQGIMSDIIEHNVPDQTFDGNQMDPSSAHMTDKEQWRYYGGKRRALAEVEADLCALSLDVARASVASKLDYLREFLHHIELRMEAKRRGVDYPNNSH